MRNATRYHVDSTKGFDLEAIEFREIQPGSEIRESVGVVPMWSGVDMKAWDGAYAFRVRVDTRRPNATKVRERVRQMVEVELEHGAAIVGPKKRRELKALAEEELIFEAEIKMKMIEVYILGEDLLIGSASDSDVDRVVGLLRKVGIAPEPVFPWGQDVADGSSGREFLGRLSMSRGEELWINSVDGAVKINLPEGRVSATGSIGQVLSLLHNKPHEIISAKVILGMDAEGGEFHLDGFPWRIRGLSGRPILTPITPGANERAELGIAHAEDVLSIFHELDASYRKIMGEVAP